MNSFCSDIDILKYEPILFGDINYAGQVLAKASGAEINAALFTDVNANFQTAAIEPQMVLKIDSDVGSLDTALEIIAVNSATQLTVSVLRPAGQVDAIPVANMQNVNYSITTYKSQFNEIFLQLAAHFDLQPANANGRYDVNDIVDTSMLRQLSVYGTLSTIYASIADKCGDKNDNFWQKSKHYQNIFEKTLQKCRIAIDIGNDGIADVVESTASVRIIRD